MACCETPKICSAPQNPCWGTSDFVDSIRAGLCERVGALAKKLCHELSTLGGPKATELVNEIRRMELLSLGLECPACRDDVVRYIQQLPPVC